MFKNKLLLILISFLISHDTEFKHTHQYPSFLRQQKEWEKSVRKHNNFYNTDSHRYWRSKYEKVIKDMNELIIHYNKLISDHNSLNYSYKELRGENIRLRYKIKRFKCYEK